MEAELSASTCNSPKQQLRGPGYLVRVSGPSAPGARRHVNSDYGLTTANRRGGTAPEEQPLGHGSAQCSVTGRQRQARRVPLESQSCPLIAGQGGDRPPFQGQAGLEVPAGGLKMHQLFQRAARIQPPSGQGRAAPPRRQQPFPPAGDHRAGGTVPAAPLETEQEQLESSTAGKPSSRAWGDAPQAGPGSPPPATGSSRPQSTPPGAQDASGFGRVPRQPRGSRRTGSWDVGTR